MVYTKIDKLKGNQLNKHLKAYHKKMLETWAQIPVYFATSAETGAGKEELLSYIGEINKQIGIGD
jgi:GTP-binding protein